MIRLALFRALRQLVLVPIVALASYYLMAALPVPTEEESKRQLSSELVESYRRDLGLGQPLGFLRPWEKLVKGERLGTTAQGVTFEEMMVKLSGSAGIGLGGLALALLWAAGFALLRAGSSRASEAAGAGLPAIAFGTPAFIPALLLAPAVVERGHLLPELAAALVVSVWPGVLLGTLVADALRQELSSDYVRTAAAKGLPRARVVARHVLPNVMPALLDSLPPTATALLAGSFAAERVLGLPYFGQLYVAAVLQKQVAVVVVATTVFAALLVVVTLAVELVRLLVDPRAREAAS
jgi:oligopeptide transport system permease protein